MIIDTNQIVTLTEATQNFSCVTRISDKTGQADIFKNSRPQYLLMNIDENPVIDLTDDEKINIVAARILKKYHAAFEKLAK